MTNQTTTPAAAVSILRDALTVMLARYKVSYTEGEEQPKTFGCRHFAETCSQCEGMVTAWKAAKQAREALTATERAAIQPAGDAVGWFICIDHSDGSKTITTVPEGTEGAFQLFSAPSAPVQAAPDARLDQWRALALQYDGHRMQALSHLQAMLQDAVKHAPIVAEFLKAGPSSTPAVQAAPVGASEPDHDCTHGLVDRCNCTQGTCGMQATPEVRKGKL